MTKATFFHNRPRQLTLWTASVLLHALVLAWILPHLGPGNGSGPVQEVPITAELLRQPPPQRAPPAPPPPVPQLAPPPVVPIALPEVIVAEQRSAPPAPVIVELEQAPPAAPAAPPPAPAQRPYKIDMPPSANLVLSVARTDADGTNWNGEAVIAWKLDGDHYKLTMEAGIRVIFTRVNLAVLTSEGRVSERGFVPVTMTEKRRGRALTATHFNEQEGRISFSVSPASVPMPAGTQDKATVPLQLAAIARGDAAQLNGDIEFMVGEDKDASLFRFVLIGQEELPTPLGKLQTWHLSRPPRPGSYSSRLDVWLAPALNWYPVQLKAIEANGAVTTQTVNKIDLTETGK